jgi:hypothetical protein
MEQDAHKGSAFLDNLKKFAEQDNVRTATTFGKISTENLKLAGITTMNPKGQVVVISAVAVRKAMHAAGLGTTDETMKCLIAVAKLGSTLAIGAAAAPATFGASAYLAVAVAAVEGYDVGAACFNYDGVVSHAVALPQ